uniref:Uncharacterized protein n=1 Tax=Promethearchaeum syntrophicum TaxID=2594042 RepID=A0A5B9D7L8_9ARCH|nr:hypothetical protein DSAG12_00836 [Candidatus Prometheoarchaeum syntrophicum]
MNHNEQSNHIDEMGYPKKLRKPEYNIKILALSAFFYSITNFFSTKIHQLR